MRKPIHPKDLATEILSRSRCCVQVGAAIADNNGRILSWGWNSEGSGFGLHAEEHAIRRANQRRLRGATIYVAGIRRRNGKLVPAKPCETCQPLIAKWGLRVVWRNNEGEWIDERRTN